MAMLTKLSNFWRLYPQNLSNFNNNSPKSGYLLSPEFVNPNPEIEFCRD
jgi:hypothetical protein